MFWGQVGFELKHRLTRISTWVYFLVYTGLAFLLTYVQATPLKGVSVNLGFSNKVQITAPIVISITTGLVVYLAVLSIAPIFGQAVFKDYESRMEQILFTAPFQKWRYLGSRFLGAFLTSIIILSGVGVAVWIVTYLPTTDAAMVGERRWMAYVMPYFTLVIPNLLGFGAIFFAMAALIKRMAPVYVSSIVLFTGWNIATNLTRDFENRTLRALLDPFGITAARAIGEYWSAAEQNTLLVPFTGVFAWNRLLWVGLGLVMGVIAYGRFKTVPRQKTRSRGVDGENEERPSVRVQLPPLAVRLRSMRMLFGLAVAELKMALSNIYLLMILLCGVLYVFVISPQIGSMFGTTTWPVSWQVLEVVSDMFGLFALIMTTFYAGELVWRDRDVRMEDVVESQPVSSSYLFGTKLICLILLQAVLTVVVGVCAMVVQVAKGYPVFDFHVYGATLVAKNFADGILLSVLALFIHTLSGHKYIGHSVMVIYFVAMMWLPQFGFDHDLFNVVGLPWESYSDMNQFDQLWYRYAAFFAYTGFFSVLSAFITVALWRRGIAGSVRQRLHRLLPSRSPWMGKPLLAISLLFLAAGGFVFYNTNILNEYHSSKSREKLPYDYEMFYKKEFGDSAIPELRDVRIAVDIFPASKGIDFRGYHRYVNPHNTPITKVMINLPLYQETTVLKWSRPATIDRENKEQGVKLVVFDPPLEPGAAVDLEYEVHSHPRGFANGGGESKKVVPNGTFFNNGDVAPILGYLDGKELESEKDRKKYGLPPKNRLAPIDNEKNRQRSYIPGDGTLIKFDAVISTESDQIAVAPGYLVKEWMDGQRRFFHYQMDKPMMNFYSVMSARYTAVRDQWQDVAIEVYHHPGHEFNIARMIDGLKDSLAYFTTHFSPYQYRQIRILEFPRYERFAQSFANTIPYSESIGFIARVRPDDPDDIDYPYYVTAHEVAHQWWAHQVVGANVVGATMLSESLAQYSALMVMEKKYGPEKMRRFLKFELDRYLADRSNSSKPETSLMLNDNEQHIHYRKGSLVFYALRDALGEEVVNGVLRQFIADYGARTPPFPRSVDLVERFKAVAPPEKQQLIYDLFEAITLYDIKTTEVQAKKVGEKYQITITGQALKYYADGAGIETAQSMQELMDVGVFDAEGKALYLQKHMIKDGFNELVIEVEREPVKGGIDPMHKLVDRNIEDNLRAVKF